MNESSQEGLLLRELHVGVVASVSAHIAKINVDSAGAPSGTYFRAGRYGRGEVGEFVLIEGQQSLVLGRIIEIRLPDRERSGVHSSERALEAVAHVQLLGSVSIHTGVRVTAGVEFYPRLGDRVYAAPHSFVANIPALSSGRDGNDAVVVKIGGIGSSNESAVKITPERLFGRHCAILGATGGGKSWTTARLIEECTKHNAKILLIDATSEYRSLIRAGIVHCHLGKPNDKEDKSLELSLPPDAFTESDFTALFRPSLGIQSPKLRDALSSLRIAERLKQIGHTEKYCVNGVLIKSGVKYAVLNKLRSHPKIAPVVHDPGAPFDVSRLIGQIEAECVWEENDSYGRKNDQHWGFCSTLVSRVAHITSCSEFSFVFSPSKEATSLTDKIAEFLGDAGTKVLRVCLSGVAQEFQAKEIVANAIGRALLRSARAGAFSERPIVVFVDEAHNFLGRNLGQEEHASRLDAFEIIAKEGRKYGLCMCLATQRPRDITEGVLSQMGTLIVHRLTNDRDRELVERACGEIDRSASAFLPTLQPGEAAIIGVDFPIPMTVRVAPPDQRPASEGPKFQDKWQIQERATDRTK